MARTRTLVRKYIATVRTVASLSAFRHKPYRLRAHSRRVSVLGRGAMNFLLIGVLSLSMLGATLTTLIAEWQQTKARTPRALQATDNDFAPAADANGTPYKAKKLAKETAASLAKTQAELQHGKFRQAKHVKVLDEARDANTRVFLNDDGTKTLERSVAATS